MAPLESQSVTAEGGGLPAEAAVLGARTGVDAVEAIATAPRLDRPLDERRKPATGHRVPWTVDPPYLVREPVYRAAKPATTWRWASHRYQLALVLTDLTLTATFALIALLLTPETPSPTVILASMLALSAATVAITAGGGGYRRISLGDGVQEYQTWIRSVAVAFGIAAAFSYVFSLAIPRGLFVAPLPLIAFGWSARYLFRRVLHRARTNGTYMMRTLLVGDPVTVERLHARFRQQAYHGFDVVGVCSSSYGLAESDASVPVLGAVADIPQVVMDHAIDTVVVEPGQVAGDSLRRLSWAIGRTPAELIVSPGLVEVLQPRLRMRPTVGLSLLHVETDNPKLRLWMKAALDRIAALVIILLLAPVLLIAALAIKLDSRGPVFFRQVRVGEGGAEFRIWKLRSMKVGAEGCRIALLENTDRDGPMFKMRRDPRITRVGNFIRRYSIDELPQLFNVIMGEMSLVGPRPPLPTEVETYQDAVSRRLLVRPGMTGLWQVSGRADLPWEESVQLDLRYVDNWSFSMDAQILWKTLRAVMGGKGAY
jgi:exopolysaccharide biosynthesis polyprenyl glycosylphosphotransferase